MAGTLSESLTLTSLHYQRRQGHQNLDLDLNKNRGPLLNKKGVYAGLNPLINMIYPPVKLT